MSMLLTATGSWLRRRAGPADKTHDKTNESNSWFARLDSLLSGIEQRRQLASLREIADDRHLLRDLGLTRDEALSGKPFRPLEGERESV